jgi:diguanylate cyclase (GGDEF)-like protein
MTLPILRLRIGPRLTLCFTLILALAIAGGWTAATASRTSRARMLETVAQSSRRLADLAEVRIALEREDRLAQRLALATDIDAAHADMNEIDARAAACRLAAQRLAAALVAPEERAAVEEMLAEDAALAPALTAARESVDGFNPGRAGRLLEERVAPAHARWLLRLDDLSERQSHRVAREIEAQGAALDRRDMQALAGTVAAALLAALVAWRLTIGIVRPLRRAIAFADAVGAGEFDAPIPPAGDDEPGQLLLALKDMAGRLQLADAAARRLAIEDGLTGAYNRRHFDAALAAEHERAIRAAQRGAQDDGARLALAMIDVDHFKEFNDRWGHPAGDACLRAVVEAVRDAGLRAGDLVARYGGEEFALVLPACDAAGARIVAERIRERIRALRLFQDDGSIVGVTATIGVAAFEDARDGTPADLLRAADVALYEGKHRGRDQVRERTIAPRRAA